ncbi:uncharacterized protein GIQ15_02356 [Arthroderma uncinatum]|uniref:uncharacterized protein n=1 Tax=Arthroderma uncinatum TaxID=74035 RepID=UPI00144AA2B9|nr:uncharacterized protein GIQ15_02356 [Arthroderma uncinatum]KAF3483032.1 hypothetical protein GIQ15_02356 [Arthroderma uncinatum]
MPKTTPPLPAESAGDEKVVSPSTSSNSPDTTTASNTTDTTSSKPRPKVDRDYLKTLDSQALGAYFRAMSEEEMEELFRTSSMPPYKGPSIPYDDYADIAYEQGKPLPTPDFSSDTTISYPPHLP